MTGKMHGLVMFDENGEVIRPSIIWCDQRTGEEVRDMLAIMPKEDWIRITANPPLTGWTASKILWVRKNEPDNYAKCAHILLPKDYIRYVLTGDFATDVSDASGMQLLDIPNRCWSEEVLKKLDIPPEWRQMLSDLYGCKVTTVRQSEGGALGDAILAGVGCGIYPSVEEACDRLISVDTSTSPVEEETAKYKEYHELYKRLYADLKDDFKALSDI